MKTDPLGSALPYTRDSGLRVLDSRQMAIKLNCTVRQVRELLSRKMIPAVADISSEKKPVWAEPEIDAWISAGCPRQSSWKKLREFFMQSRAMRRV